MIKLLKFLKSYRIHITFTVIFLFFQAISELLLPTIMSDIVDEGIVKQNEAYIFTRGKEMLFIALGGALCALIATLLASISSMGLGKTIRSKLFSHVSEFSLREIDKVGTPSLITRNTNDVVQVQMVTLIILRMMISAPIMMTGALIMALRKDTGLSWVLIASIPVIAVVIAIVAAKAVPLFKKLQVKVDKLNGVVREILTGMRVIRAFNKSEVEKKKFDAANEDLTKTAIKVYVIFASVMPIMMLVINLTTIAIIWFGAIRIDNGNMQVGDLMAFLQYAMQIMISIMMASMMIVMLPRAQASASRINEVLDITTKIHDVDNTVEAKGKKGYVEFKNVTFTYEGAEEPVLKNISFKTKPGQVTAIIGGTGSGKSTFVNLIPRFYDIDSGEILINDVNISNIKQEELRSKIGLVPQKAVLFTGTIKENIKFGKQDASDEEIEKACEIAQANEFIEKMKDKFESEISQGGKNISGGQKQRLSIARALIRKPEIYIFDDSFSALDFKTDAKLRNALFSEIPNSAMIIVAQRISTVMNSDQIIVLDNGKIVGTGKHKDLLKTCSVYKEIVSSQLSEEEIA